MIRLLQRPVLISTVLVVGVIAAVAQNAARPASRSAGGAPGSHAPVVGEPVTPILSKSLSGKEVNLPGDYSGKLVLLDFWSTWCPVCKREIPRWRELYEKTDRKQLVILGVLQDSGHNVSLEAARKFIDEQKIPWDNVYDDGLTIADTFGVNNTPTLFLIDGDTGVVLASGADLRAKNLARTVEQCLVAKLRRSSSTMPAVRPDSPAGTP